LEPVNSLGAKPEELGPKIGRRWDARKEKMVWPRREIQAFTRLSSRPGHPKAAIMTAQTCFQITQSARLLSNRIERGSAPLMGRHACAAFSGMVALATCLATSALAGEATYCVTCMGPDQVYRCRVTGEGSKPNDALKLYCVIRTAKEGHHASCSAENATPACAGPEKIYAYDGPDIDQIAQDPRVKNLMKRVEHNNKVFDKPKAEGQAPQTMVELTGRALSASRQGLRNARSALTGSHEDAQPLPVSPQATSSTQADPASNPKPTSRMQRASAAMGSLARRSYHCLRSFFLHCGGESTTRSAVQ
jgi:hypothetical protein